MRLLKFYGLAWSLNSEGWVKIAGVRRDLTTVRFAAKRL